MPSVKNTLDVYPRQILYLETNIIILQMMYEHFLSITVHLYCDVLYTTFISVSRAGVR